MKIRKEPRESDLGNSWLVQRLKKPFAQKGPLDALGESLAFGGGLRDGGLAPQAMNLLQDVFSFDYMGSSEFEWGAVPEALRKIAKAKLTAFTFDIDGHTIFALAPAKWRSEAEARIREFANDYGPSYYRLQESARLRGVLDGKPYHDHLAGWLELDNGFMFFTDESMWSKTCDLFGVPR